MNILHKKIDSTKKIDSLNKRYSYKLFTNLIGFCIGFITMGIVPRGLGPKAYGDFSYLVDFFGQIISLLDTGMSIGFYTKLSQRPREASIVSFYLYYSCIVTVIILIFVVLIQLSSIYKVILPSQSINYIYYAMVFGILYWLVQILASIADARALTVSMEKINITQKVLGVILILLLFWLNQLHLTQYFLYHYFNSLFLIIAYIFLMKHNNYSLSNNWKLSKNQITNYIKEFYKYIKPLYVYALVGMVVSMLDRWILQNYSGSTQQGFYSLSYQIGSVCFMFTYAMMPLITREFAVAFGNNNLPEMSRLFRRYGPLLYGIAAYLCCFIAIQADSVTYILGGAPFKEAAFAVTVMALFPIHQTYGQLSGALFFATGRTILYRNIGIIFMIIGVPITYLLIAPNNMFGLDAGASGLAIKMVLMQFIAVNVLFYFNAKLLNLNFMRYLGHQVLSIACLLCLAIVSSLGTNIVFFEWTSIIYKFIIAGVIYSVLVFAATYCFPVIMGLRKTDIQFGLRFVLNKAGL